MRFSGPEYIPCVKHPVLIDTFASINLAQEMAQHMSCIVAARTGMHNPDDKNTWKADEDSADTRSQGKEECPFDLESKAADAAPVKLAVTTVVETQDNEQSTLPPAPPVTLVHVEGREDNPFSGASLCPSVHIVAKPPLSLRRTITMKMQQEYLENLRCSAADVLRIQNAPQRSPEWFQAREGRVSGSIIASITGENPFTKQDALLREKLWGEFKGNAATRYGTWNEPVAEYMHLEWLRKKDKKVKLQFPGLMVNQKFFWLSYSPDGIVEQDCGTFRLAEYKCPYKKSLYRPKCSGEPSIPIYYRSQIQYGMKILDLQSCDFLVWTPNLTRVENYARDDKYCTWMMKKVNDFYFQRYLPALVAKKQGWLPVGCVDVSSVCNVELISELDVVREIK